MYTKNGIKTTYYILSPACGFKAQYMYLPDTLLLIKEYSDGTPLVLHVTEAKGYERTLHPQYKHEEELLHQWGYMYNIKRLTKLQYEEKRAVYIL